MKIDKSQSTNRIKAYISPREIPKGYSRLGFPPRDPHVLVLPSDFKVMEQMQWQAKNIMGHAGSFHKPSL